MATEALDHRRVEFLALAGTAFDQMFGSDGQNGLVTFAAREEQACAVTDGLARWLMGTHLAQDPAGSVAGGQTCPICQRAVPPAFAGSVQPQVRAVMTRRGPIEYRRVAYLSEDGRDQAFYAHRPRGRAAGSNRLRLSA